MAYAEINGTTLVQYPYGFAQLQEDNPYTNYGDNYDVAYWFPQTNAAIENGYELVSVTDVPQPAYDPSHQVCTEGTPVLVNGVWTQTWVVSEMSPAQIAEYQAQTKSFNKQQATTLLDQTDWTDVAAVADPAVSNPYLTNQSEFLAYRSAVRAIAVNPPATPAVFPPLPAEKWSS